MTLSRFVRVYIYQPLSIPLTRFASEKGYGKWATMTVSVFLPAFLSMLVIGAWHGPNWTYVLFGAMQGAYIIIDELHTAFTRKRRRKKPDTSAAVFCYGLLTLLAFAAAAVPFRSETIQDAFRIFGGMAGLHGLGLRSDFWAPGGNGVLLPGLSLAYGVLNYTMFGLSDRDYFTIRNEWYRDERGMRTGFAGNYTSHTIGLSHQFNDVMMLRPEIGYYRNWDNFAFDNGTKHGVWIYGFDFTYRF